MKRLFLSLCLLILAKPALAQSHLATVAASMTPNSWAILNQDTAGDAAAGYSWNTFLYPGTVPCHTDPFISFQHDAVYDSVANKIWVAGGPHYLTGCGDLNGGPERIGVYDVATNHWSVVATNGTYDSVGDHVLTNLTSCGYGGHTVFNAFDPVRHELYYGLLTQNDCLTRYNVNTGLPLVSTIQPISAPGGGFAGDEPAMEYFPTRTGGARMFYTQASLYGEFDGASNMWTTPPTLYPDVTYTTVRGNQAQYSSRCQCIIIMGGIDGASLSIYHQLFQYSKDGVMTKKANFPAGITVYTMYSIAKVDPLTGLLIVVSNTLANLADINSATTGVVTLWSYDPLTDAWTNLSATAGGVALNAGGYADVANWWTTGTNGPGMPAMVVATPVSLTESGQTYSVIAFMSGVSTGSTYSNSKVYLYKPPNATGGGGGSFATRCAASGVIGCYGFDSAADVRNFPAGSAYPLKYFYDAAGPCGSAGLGTNYLGISADRLSTEATAYAKVQDIQSFPSVGPCNIPHINTANPHSGAGALEEDIVATVSMDVQPSGYFDTTFQGIDHQPNARYGGPDQGGELYYQFYYRTHNIVEDDFSTGFGNQFIKSVILCNAVPTVDHGGCGSDATYESVLGQSIGYPKPTPASNARNGLLSCYTHYLAGSNIYPCFELTNTYLQNSVGCLYNNPAPLPQVYNYPPCVKTISDTWQEITIHYKILPIASNFTVSGSTITRTGTFGTWSGSSPTGPTGPIEGWVGRWVYIAGDTGTGNGYYAIATQPDADHITVTGTPSSGSGKTIYASGYPNSLIEEFIDGQLINSANFMETLWDQANPGWGQIRLLTHFGATAHDTTHSLNSYVLYDDVVISTQPIAMITTVACTTPDHLLFSSQPSSAVVAASLGTVTVGAYDSAGTFCNTDTSTITITNKAGTCTGMALGGTASGSNAFTTTNLTENAAGACTLHATDGALTAVDSTAITITSGAPDTMAFSTQPTDVISGSSFVPTVKVTVSLAAGGTDTAFTGNILLAMSACGAASIGTFTQAAVAGVATFTGLGASNVATGCTFTANNAGMASVTSNPFNVTSGALIVSSGRGALRKR